MRLQPRALVGILLFPILGLFVSNRVCAQQLTHTCKFDKGPRAGLTLAYPTAQPIPVGSSCQDGVASTGVAVPDNPNPQLTHTCKFDQGPRAGQTQVYPQSVPVGTSCWDGLSSSGVTIADSTSAPQPAKPPPPQNSARDSVHGPRQAPSQPTQEPVQRQDTPQVSPRDSNQVPRQPIQRQDTSSVSRSGNASNELTAEATGTGTLQDQVNTGVQLFQNLATRDPFNQRIQAARKRYFRDLPSAPDLPAAKEEFLKLLHDKNSYYILRTLQGGQQRSLSVLGPPPYLGSYKAVVDGVGEIDGGIPEQAFRSFMNWQDAILAESFPHSNPQDFLRYTLDPTVVIDAMASSMDRFIAYSYSLNWAEFERSGLDLRKIWTPKDYALRMMAWNLLERPIRPGLPVPDPVQDPVNAYNTMSAILGEKVLLDAAAKVLAAKRSPTGWLDLPVQVDVPNFAYRSATGQQFWFDSLLADSSDRAYAICMGRKFMDSPLPYVGHPIGYGDAWQEGANWYGQLVREYGEPAVLAAAHKVRIAPKNPDGHRVICSQQYCNSPSIFLVAILKDSSITVPPPVPRLKVTEIDGPQLVKTAAAEIVTGVVADVVLDPRAGSRAIITLRA